MQTQWFQPNDSRAPRFTAELLGNLDPDAKKEAPKSHRASENDADGKTIKDVTSALVQLTDNLQEYMKTHTAST